MRSSNRAPTAIITSHSDIAMLASQVPCMPSMPRNCLSDAGKTPRPITVSVTGKPVMRAKSVNSCDAAVPELTTPPPA